MQHRFDKAHAFREVEGNANGVDLMIVDISKGLPVPMVSSPHTSMLGWNMEVKYFLSMVFDFGSLLVHYNRCFYYSTRMIFN